MNKFFTIVKKEFTKSVKKISFWVLTIWVPVIYLILFWIIIFSTSESEKEKLARNNSIKNIFIYDESKFFENIFNNSKNPKNEKIKFVNSYKEWYDSFIWKKESIFLNYDKNFLENKKSEIYVNSKDLIDSYTEITDKITKDLIFEKSQDKKLLDLYSSKFITNVKKFEDWKEIQDIDEKWVFAYIWIFLFIIMISFWSWAILTSVTQEKENRILEIILSTVNSKTFVLWKMISWFLIVFTQLLVLWILPLILLIYTKDKLPFDINNYLLNLTFYDIFIIIFYVLTWYFIFASIMLSVWALAQNSKQAWSMSSPFMIFSFIPFYLITIISTKPTWAISLFFSYFPLTSPLVSLFRTIIWWIYPFEKFLLPIIVIFYLIISIIFAKIFFEKWAIEYNKKFSFKNIFKKN